MLDPETHRRSLWLELIRMERHIAEARERGAAAAEAIWKARYKLIYDELASVAPWIAAKYRPPE